MEGFRKVSGRYPDANFLHDLLLVDNVSMCITGSCCNILCYFSCKYPPQTEICGHAYFTSCFAALVKYVKLIAGVPHHDIVAILLKVAKEHSHSEENGKSLAMCFGIWPW